MAKNIPKHIFFREINGFEMWMRCGDTDILSTILDAPIVVLVFSTFGMFLPPRRSQPQDLKKMRMLQLGPFGEMIFEG